MSNLPRERALVTPLPPRAPRHWVYPAPRGLGELPRGVTSKIGGIPWREHSPTQIKGPTERSVVAGSLFWQQLLGDHWQVQQCGRLLNCNVPHVDVSAVGRSQLCNPQGYQMGSLGDLGVIPHERVYWGYPREFLGRGILGGGGGWGVVRREAQIIAPTYKSETLRKLGGSFEVGGLQSGWLSKHWGKVTKDFAGYHVGR